MKRILFSLTLAGVAGAQTFHGSLQAVPVKSPDAASYVCKLQSDGNEYSIAAAIDQGRGSLQVELKGALAHPAGSRYVYKGPYVETLFEPKDGPAQHQYSIAAGIYTAKLSYTDGRAQPTLRLLAGADAFECE